MLQIVLLRADGCYDLLLEQSRGRVTSGHPDIPSTRVAWLNGLGVILSYVLMGVSDL